MISVGMDVHWDKTVCHFLDPQVEESRRHHHVTVPTTEEGLRSALAPLKRKCRVAFEIGTQAQWVASVVRPLATEVQVANPSRIPWLFRDGRKNDKLDARKLAKLLYMGELPTVHLPAVEISAWRALINHRRTLIRRRTMIKNQIRALLRTFHHRCPHKSCWTRVGRVWLESVTFDEARTVMMQGLLAELDFLETRREQAEAQLEKIAASQPAVALLRTIPGVGPRTAEAIVAFTDDIRRFADRKHFTSYFGMTPTQDSSGLIVRHGHISKRGPSVVRWVLVEAVHRVIGYCRPLRAFFERIYRGKKDRYKKAIVATGRKVLAIAYAMMRDERAFDADRAWGPAA